MNEQTLITELSESGRRLDLFLTEYLSEHSRSLIQKLIREGSVLVDGQTVKASFRLQGDEEIRISFPDAIHAPIEAENIPLDIFYEDEYLLVVNKPKGMVVHPAPGHWSGTLVNALMYHAGASLSGINGVIRPGIVHRIDRDTTGLLLVCKNDKAHEAMADQLKNHSMTRRYTALAEGRFSEEEGVVDAPIGRDKKNRLRMAVDPEGRSARTHYQVIQRFDKYTLLHCRLETGRTHQIRVHMAHLGHPLAGDLLYAGHSLGPVEGQYLHAGRLGFVHPANGTYMEFEAPLPAYFEERLRRLP